MTEMLGSYEIILDENTEDVKAKLLEFKESDEVKGKMVERLHFHFSGHGVIYRGQRKKKDTIDTGDQCLVGTSGILLSDTALQNILWLFLPKKLP